MHVTQPSGGLAAARSGGEGLVDSAAFEGLARAGVVARGLVHGIIGALALRAGLAGALAKILRALLLRLLFGLVAGGLIPFALYSLSDARYRRI